MALFDVVGPLIRCLDPERAHLLTIRALRCGLVPGVQKRDRPMLASNVFGLTFPSPVGLAAGFDKDAEVPDAILALGFGFTEVGSITPQPQPGNPKPRLFRLAADEAVINRMGFNNHGADPAYARLSQRQREGIVGINLGKNKTSEDAIADYVFGVERFASLADYLVVNVSSPNTPGLRALQDKAALVNLMQSVIASRNAADRRPPVLLKIAPDLTDEDKSDIASVVMETGVDGLICTNTTIERPSSLRSRDRAETGGLSGKPLFEASTRVLSEMYALTNGRLPLIGVGGISDGETAYAKIKAGASLLQLYSALVYQGPALVQRILDDLEDRLKVDGFSTITEAVGADHR